jgi:ribosomal protein S10
MFVIIDIYSKNSKSLNYFLEFFCNEKLIQKLNLSILKITSQRQKKKKVFTVLKSPHVNKIAQEQFEYRIYKKRLKCFIPQISLFLIFFKKIRFNLFADLGFKIKLISNLKVEKQKIKNKFNVDNYCLFYKELNLVKYLKILEISGEFILKLK